MRLDKWLWAARFFKTRSLAQKAVAGGRVQLNGERTKPAHEVKAGDMVVVRVGDGRWEVKVAALSERRGPAEEARKLYEETEASRTERERRGDLRRWGAEVPGDVLEDIVQDCYCGLLQLAKREKGEFAKLLEFSDEVVHRVRVGNDATKRGFGDGRQRREHRADQEPDDHVTARKNARGNDDDGQRQKLGDH